MDIHVVQKVMKLNDEIALRIRDRLREANVTAINMMSGPGAGKTTLIEQALHHGRDRYRIGVIEGDPETSRDAARIAAFDVPVVQVNTGGGCHLEAYFVERALDRLPLAELDLIIIENVGNLVCPVEFALGESKRVGVVSIPEGHDKAAKYPKLFRAADLVILNKLDLLPYIHFNEAQFDADLRVIHDGVPVLRVSCATTQGIPAWCDWLAGLVRPASAAARCP
jgi:hydrogenase nickel incorporation protein HypB